MSDPPDPTASPSPTPPDQITTYSPMVKCEVCGQTCLITSTDINSYISRGWPRHCGMTMTYVPAPPIPDSSSSESVPKISAGVSGEERRGPPVTPEEIKAFYEKHPQPLTLTRGPTMTDIQRGRQEALLRNEADLQDVLRIPPTQTWFTREDVQLLRDAARVFDPDTDDARHMLENLADRIEGSLNALPEFPDVPR